MRRALFFMVAVLFMFSPASALDAPHTPTPAYGIDCSNCHWVTGSEAPSWATPGVNPDDTLNNQRCNQCHAGAGAPNAATHSKTTTGSTRWAEKGGWKVECVVCHNPHYQRQSRRWAAESYLTTGTVTVIGAYNEVTKTTPITVSATISGEYEGYYFIPNTAYRTFSYKISTTTNGRTSFDVKGQVTPGYASAGNPFAIVYSKNITDSLIYSGPGGGVNAEVKMYAPAGAHGPGSSTNPSSSVCYVCHTQTSYWSAVSGDTGHKANLTCSECHQHNIGFKPSCIICHAYPPTDASGLVQETGFITHSATAGAHGTHVNTKGIDCDACHYNSVGRNATHENQKVTMGFNNLGGTTQGGSYDGQSAVAYDATVWTTVSNGDLKKCSNVYCHGNYSGSGKNASPVWDQPSSAACGTCHNASNATAPASGTHLKHAADFGFECTICHSGIVSGSGQYGYSIAAGSKHVNGYIDWAFSTDPRAVSGDYSIPAGTASPSDGTTPRAYGNCGNIYCHSNVQPPNGGVGGPTVYATPQWGGAELKCGGCHQAGNGIHSDDGPTIGSGSHTKHLAYDFTAPGVIKCTLCHKWNPSGVGLGCDNCHVPHDPDFLLYIRPKHVNHEVNVSFETSFTGNVEYSGNPLPGDGYGTCSSSYCHGNFPGSGKNASPAWGSPASGACGTCHEATNTTPPVSGSHSKHARSTNYNYPCTRCHGGVVGGSGPSSYVITDKTRHVNRYVDWSFDSFAPATATYSIPSGSAVPSDGTTPRAFGSCSNTYCHGDGTSVLTGVISNNISPSWGSPGPLVCNSCHGFPPSYPQMQPKANSHVNGYHNAVSCNYCHYATTTTYRTITNQARHANGVYDVVPDATTTYGGVPVDFTYAYDARCGGSCSNISCHGDSTYYWYNKYFLQNNIAPVGNGTYSLDKFNLTVTDHSSDPDWNACGHSGPAHIRINWGDGTVSDYYPVLTDIPADTPYTHTYTTSGTRDIGITVTDNMYGASNTTVTYGLSVQVPPDITIGGSITRADGTPLSGISVILKYGTTTTSRQITTTDPTGHYSFTDTYVAVGYTVIPNQSGTTFSPAKIWVDDTTSTANFIASP